MPWIQHKLQGERAKLLLWPRWRTAIFRLLTCTSLACCIMRGRPVDSAVYRYVAWYLEVYSWAENRSGLDIEKKKEKKKCQYPCCFTSPPSNRARLSPSVAVPALRGTFTDHESLVAAQSLRFNMQCKARCWDNAAPGQAVGNRACQCLGLTAESPKESYRSQIEP